jgi:hypothetical protein
MRDPLGGFAPLMQPRLLSLAVSVCLVTGLTLACSRRAAPLANVQAAISAEIARGVDATRTKNIDAYMDQIPLGMEIRDERGAIITRDQQRVNTLRDWSIIALTRAISVVIDSLTARDDSVIVYTYQRWDRLMYERDGRTLDTVVTTQRHRELWRRGPQGWRSYRIEELGGTVEINGKPYAP